ncbi:MAG: hypothetical protein WD467_02505 [Candidatus Saccharimonadales bacterium]
MKLVKNSKRRALKKQQERERALDFIANHAAKKDFIDWLNATYEQKFAEDAEWDQLKREVQANTAIHTQALHTYAGTLTDQEDVNKLLRDVEKETTKAEAVVSELYDASNARRLQPVIGGASLLSGFLLVVFATSLMTGLIDIGITTDLQLYLAIISGMYGVLNLLAGILLILE